MVPASTTQIPLGNYNEGLRTVQLRDNFILKMYDQEIAGKLSSKVKSSTSEYTPEKALEKAYELQQNKSVNTFLQGNIIPKISESQILAM